MPTFKLNGRDVEYREGEVVLEAAARAGVPIPYYCYHPDLSSPANCRMCLVEMVGAPKLIPSCQWPVNEKMEILTESERVQQAQRDVQEYLLINHPLDCPICDQAGECKLQQYAYLFGPPASSMEEPKVKLEKRKVLGPNVVLDQERCISCTRCVRFCEEVTGTGELAMVHRSHFSSVDRHPEQELDNAYSGCVVDMCPVGALTDRHFRFQSRVWYLQPIASTCSLCSRGCNVQVDRRGERGQRPLVKRIRGRRNPEVNAAWICDEGRYSHRRPGDGDRPVRARGGSVTGDAAFAGLDAALAAAADVLRQQAGETGWLGVLASGAETNEELAAVAALARAADADALLTVPEAVDEDEDGILRRTDKVVNRRGARRIGYGTDVDGLKERGVLLVVDADLRREGGLSADEVPQASGATLLAMVAHERPWLSDAVAVLPLANAFEKDGTVVSTGDILQRVARVVPPPEHCRPASRHAQDLAVAAGLAEVPAKASTWLRRLTEAAGPLAGVDPERLDRWGARLPSDGGEAQYVEEPMQLFGASPRTFAEGEYRPFLPWSTPQPALHVAAGLPPLAHARDLGGADEEEETP